MQLIIPVKRVLQNVAYFCLVYQSCRLGMSVTGPHFGLPVDVQRDASRPSMARSIAASMPYKALWTSTGRPKCFTSFPYLGEKNQEQKQNLRISIYIFIRFRYVFLLKPLAWISDTKSSKDGLPGIWPLSCV